jgi:hypothetical protein
MVADLGSAMFVTIQQAMRDDARDYLAFTTGVPAGKTSVCRAATVLSNAVGASSRARTRVAAA